MTPQMVLVWLGRLGYRRALPDAVRARAWTRLAVLVFAGGGLLQILCQGGGPVVSWISVGLVGGAGAFVVVGLLRVPWPQAAVTIRSSLVVVATVVAMGLLVEVFAGLAVAVLGMPLWLAYREFAWHLLDSVPKLQLPAGLSWADHGVLEASVAGRGMLLAFTLLVLAPLVRVAISVFTLIADRDARYARRRDVNLRAHWREVRSGIPGVALSDRRKDAFLACRTSIRVVPVIGISGVGVLLMLVVFADQASVGQWQWAWPQPTLSQVWIITRWAITVGLLWQAMRICTSAERAYAVTYSPHLPVLRQLYGTDPNAMDQWLTGTRFNRSLRLAHHTLCRACLLLLSLLALTAVTSLLIQLGLLKARGLPPVDALLAGVVSQTVGALPGPDVQAILHVGAAIPVEGWVGQLCGLVARSAVWLLFIVPVAVSVRHLFFPERRGSSLAEQAAAVRGFLGTADRQHELLQSQHDLLVAAVSASAAASSPHQSTRPALPEPDQDLIAYLRQTLSTTTAFGEGELLKAATAWVEAHEVWYRKILQVGRRLNEPAQDGRLPPGPVAERIGRLLRLDLGTYVLADYAPGSKDIADLDALALRARECREILQTQTTRLLRPPEPAADAT